MNKSAGFLLFEVMVAVAVVGISMATILQTISTAVRATQAAKDTLYASQLLSNKLWEITAKGTIVPGTHEGPCAENPSYQYRVVVEELFAEARLDTSKEISPQALSQEKPRRLALVSVTLTWTFVGKTKSLSAQTYLPIEEEKSPAPSAVP